MPVQPPAIPSLPAGHAARVALGAMLELAYPTRCVGCDEPGTLLCDPCRLGLPWIEQRWACPTCGAPFGWLVCTECGRDWGLSTICACAFTGPAARLVTCYKDEHEHRLAPVIAAAMATALDEASGVDIPSFSRVPRVDLASVDAIAFVPATAEAYARRGFDHMERVAAALSAETGIPVADVLLRERARDQRELGREDRAVNALGTCRAIEDLSGARLLLADDVVTTGASLREAARALRSRGAEEVTGCAFARVW